MPLPCIPLTRFWHGKSDPLVIITSKNTAGISGVESTMYDDEKEKCGISY